MPTDPPPPRRKWHFNRWLIVAIIAVFGWSGWRAYAFRSALQQAERLGWAVGTTNPYGAIWTDWKAAFNTETWITSATSLSIPTSKEFEQHLAIVRQLNPKVIHISYNASTMRDLTSLSRLPRLEEISLIGCTGLENLDGIENLPALRSIWFTGCAGLTNVDGFKSLPSLQNI